MMYYNILFTHLNIPFDYMTCDCRFFDMRNVIPYDKQ